MKNSNFEKQYISSSKEDEYSGVSIIDYMALARPDHWFKNIFMLPGVFFGLMYFPIEINFSLITKLLLGVVATCLIASANYVINEWLDAEFDKFHPIKKIDLLLLNN